MPVPYAGNASNYPSSIDILSGSDAPGTTVFNTPWEGNRDAIAWLKARVANAGQNWGKAFPCTAFAPSGTYNLAACAWDPLTSRWLVGVNADVLAQNAAYAFVTYGLDLDLAEAYLQVGSGSILTGSGPVVRALSQDPTTAGKYWAGLYLQTSPATTCAVYSCATLGSAWSSAVRTWGAAGHPATDIKIAVFNGYLIAALQQGGIIGSATGPMLSSTNNSGSTWADYFMLSTGAVTDLVAGPSQVIAVNAFSANTFNQLYTSTDALAWTPVSLPGIGTFDQPAGIAWDQQREQWILAINTTSTVKVYFYTSPDGITWTKVTTPPALSMQIADIAVLCGNYVCTLADAASAGPSGQIYSEDGGATWYFSQAGFAENIATADYKYMRSQIAQSPIGLLAHNALRARFSLLAGLPPVAL